MRRVKRPKRPKPVQEENTNGVRASREPCPVCHGPQAMTDDRVWCIRMNCPGQLPK